MQYPQPKNTAGAFRPLERGFEVAWVPYFLARMDNLYTEQALGVHGRRFTGALLLDSGVLGSHVL